MSNDDLIHSDVTIVEESKAAAEHESENTTTSLNHVSHREI
jgi:hypothetical protein